MKTLFYIRFFSLFIVLLDRLIPRIPQKLNYLHWIEDLLERKNDAIGIDIGMMKHVDVMKIIRLCPFIFRFLR